VNDNASQLNALGQSLARLRADGMGVSAFCAQARTHDALLAALPPRYAEVWLGLLDRLESSALFNEESCSFSQSALLDNLEVWLQKASLHLNP
jgi:hypothetical protein